MPTSHGSLRFVLLDAELRAWIDAHDGEVDRAWSDDSRPVLATRLALALGVDRTAVVAATADIVADALRTVTVADLRPRRALLTSLRWLAGQTDGVGAWASGFSAMEALARVGDPAVSDAIRAAANLAFACDDRAEAAYYAHQGYAALAVAHAVAVTRQPVRAAAHLHARISVRQVMLSLEQAMTPPLPLPGPLDAADGGTDSFYC